MVALKGDDTLVASPDGLVAVSPGRAPGLATAGTGDVLTGVVAALLASRPRRLHRDGRGRCCCTCWPDVWRHGGSGRRRA